MASRPGGSGQAAGQGAQLSPSQEGSHRAGVPRLDCISTPLGDFFLK